LLVLAVLGGCSPSQSRVIAHVGSQDITQDEFEHAARLAPAYTIDPSPEGKRALLDDLVSRTLLVAEAKRRGYDKGPEMQHGLSGAGEDVLPQILYTRLVAGRVSVSEDEARALWQHQNEEWHLAQIFTFDERDAKNVVGALERGMPFAQAAVAMSKDRD